MLRSLQKQRHRLFCVRCFPLSIFRRQEAVTFFLVWPRMGAETEAPLLSRCHLWFIRRSADITTLKVKHENPKIFFQLPNPAQYFSCLHCISRWKPHMYILWKCTTNFTSVSVNIISCDSHKNLGRWAALELAGHCIRTQCGAQRGQAISQVPKLKSSLHLPTVRCHCAITICWCQCLG